MNTAYQSLCARLMMAGVPDARFDAVQLYKFVTGRDPRLDNGPTPDEASSLRVLGERRAAREPLQYLLGEWDFMGFTLKVGRGVLCPRADSEVVCEAAIELLKDAEAPVVYDLCAGTGCLGLGIARHLPGAAVTCVEKSADAWPYLTANVAGTGVQAVQDDILTYYNRLPSGGADLIISNPPYLTAEEMAHLMPETAKEPAMALDGGADGLDFYRLLTAHYRDALRPGGWLCWRSAVPRPPTCWRWGRLTAGSTAAAVKTTAAMTGLFCCKNLKKAAENPIYGTQNTQQNVVICS